MPFTSFYNASNIVIKYEGHKNGEVQLLNYDDSKVSPKDWNTRVLYYTSNNKRVVDNLDSDSITISSS